MKPNMPWLYFLNIVLSYFSLQYLTTAVLHFIVLSFMVFETFYRKASFINVVVVAYRNFELKF